MKYWRDIDLRRKGYTPISGVHQFPDMPGVGKLLKVAAAENVTVASVVAFQISTDIWAIYLRPDATGPYVSEPLMGARSRA